MLSWLRAWVAASTGRPMPAEPPAPAPLTQWGRYWRVLRNATLAVVAVMVIAGAGWYALSANRHPDWAVIVVAGDAHAHDGGPTEAFDNARRDVSAGLVAIGFRPEHIHQFSTRPERYAGTTGAEGHTIGIDLYTLAAQVPAGCLLYFSSHGAPQGLLLGGIFLRPIDLAHIVDGSCGKRPTVVILSACFSGAFVPALAGDNRMIMTAARADRTSFGCGQDSKYPYFDTCVIANLRSAGGFLALADRVRDCVSKAESDTGMSPPSEPQVFVGSKIAASLPHWN
jgi:Peptidase C13 family